jgi:hypothetical protein
MTFAFTLAFQAAAVVLLADFAAGFVHWLEDAYAREDTPILGPLVARANILHHHCPRAFTKLNWWQSSWVLLTLSLLLVLGAWGLGWLTWHVWLFAALTANANQIHKWAHRTRAENGRLVSFLQDIRLLQTPRHHALHHTDPKNSHYCSTTNLLNPLLDAVRFWAGLEWLLARFFGLHRRVDTSVAGHGPEPAWIADFRHRPVRTSLRPCADAPTPQP